MTKEEYLTVGRNAKGKPLFRVRLLAALARALSVQFKIGGWPYGADYGSAINADRTPRDLMPMQARKP